MAYSVQRNSGLSIRELLSVHVSEYSSWCVHPQQLEDCTIIELCSNEAWMFQSLEAISRETLLPAREAELLGWCASCEASSNLLNMSYNRLRMQERSRKISKWFVTQICCDFNWVFLGFMKKNVIGFPMKVEDKGSKGSLSRRICSGVIPQGGSTHEGTKGLVLFQD